MSAAAVVVILNGIVVASAPPAQLLFGHVMAPLTPVITQFTERAAVDGNTITLVRNGHTCVLRVGSTAITCDGASAALPVAPYGRGGIAYVPLAEVARALGGAAEYNPHSHIVALDVPPPTTVKTPAPFNPAAPSVAPTVVFTPSPSPAPPAPKPSDPGSPQPRRTAIPATPSRFPEN